MEATDLILAYGAGLLTLINPCILPVLPIVLASALQADCCVPLALAAGMALAFVVLGVGVASLGPALGLDPDGLRAGRPSSWRASASSSSCRRSAAGWNWHRPRRRPGGCHG